VTFAPPAYRFPKARLAKSETAEPKRRHLRTGGSDMMNSIVFLNWTEQARQAFKDRQKRYQTAKSVVEKSGGRILSAYVTTGQYDRVVALEMPNDDALAKYVELCPGRRRRGKRAHHRGTRLYNRRVCENCGGYAGI
jgi:uncharacterized protein with GYD domain